MPSNNQWLLYIKHIFSSIDVNQSINGNGVNTVLFGTIDSHHSMCPLNVTGSVYRRGHIFLFIYYTVKYYITKNKIEHLHGKRYKLAFVKGVEPDQPYQDINCSHIT